MRLSLLNPQQQRALWGGYTPEGPPLLLLEIDVDIFIAKGKQMFSVTACKQMHACICLHLFASVCIWGWIWGKSSGKMGYKQLLLLVLLLGLCV